MRKRRRLFSVLVAAVVFLTSIAFSPREVRAESPWDAVNAADWMANIDGNLRISRVNIPGTHDSGTQYTSLDASAKCQDKSVAEQLELGVRFLDIRVKADGDKLYLVHGSATCYDSSNIFSRNKLYLENVLESCYAFLEAHPTETIFMSIKKDAGNENDGIIKKNVHETYIAQNPDYWYSQNGNPTLNSVRGKIVLARRYHNYDANGNALGDLANDAGVHFVWADQGGSEVQKDPWAWMNVANGNINLWIQDRYEYSVENKWNAVKQGLDAPPLGDTSYFLNFMSSAASSPSSTAKTINANFQNYELTQDKVYGWIIMDFVTPELAKKVIASNKYIEIPEKVQIAKTKEALEIPETITADLKLPLTGEEAGAGEGTAIAWSCGDNAEIIKTYGTECWVVRPSAEKEDVSVTLKAVITSGRYSDEKLFSVTVKKSNGVSLGELNAAVSMAEKVYEEALAADIYTKTSVDNLANAIKAAKELVKAESEGEAVTAAQAEEAAAAVNEASAGCVLKSLAELNGNLLGWYPLDEDSKDATANKNDGTAKGVAFSRQNGAVFTGTGKLQSYISLPANMFDGKDQLTISFWTKDDGTNASRNQAVFGFGSGTEPDGDGTKNVYKYLLINPSNNNCLKAVVTNNTWRNELGFKGTEASFPKKTWAHITCVFDGTKFTLYKDGTLVGTKDTGIKLTDFGTNRVAYIGNSIWGNNDNDYIGAVKDFRVYKGALKESQVKEIYGYINSLPVQYVKKDLIDAVTKGLGIEGVVGEDGSVSLDIAKESVSLPTTGYNNASIRWESSKPEVINPETGSVTNPETAEENITLTAKITLSDNQKAEVIFHCTVRPLAVYTVSFDANNETEIITVNVKQGEKAVKPADPEKEGYTFAGWFEENSNVEFDFNTKITKSLVLTAKWTEVQKPSDPSDPVNPGNPENFTVSFHGDNGSEPVIVTVKKGDKVAKPADPEKEGYTFAGWYQEGVETEFDFETEITENLTLKAKWTKKQTPTDPSDPSDPSDPDDPSDPSDPSDPDDPSDPSDPDDPSGPSDPDDPSDPSGPVEEAKKDLIDAVTKELGIEGVVGEDGSISLEVAAGSLNLAAEGENDVKITWESSNPQVIDPVTGKVTSPETGVEHVTLKATLTLADGTSAEVVFQCAVKPLPTCTISFDAANGTEIVVVTVTKGGKVQQPENPVREGYTFAGWYAEGAETIFDFNTEIKESVKIIAKWSANSGNVTPPVNNVEKISIADAKITVAKTVYNGKAKNPKVTVISNGKVLSLGNDYQVSYKNNKNIGQGKVYVTGINQCTGSRVIAFDIKPAKNKIVKLTNKAGRKIVVKFSKSKGVKNYEISYATNKAFKSAKKASSKKTTCTLKNLKKGKTYYIKVCAYKKVGKKKICSDYSKVMKIKVKK